MQHFHSNSCLFSISTQMPNKMKKFFLLILTLILSGLMYAQFYPYWTEPIAISDSLTINSNAVVLTMKENYSDDIFCFYEKKLTPAHPSQIWYRNINTMEDEQLMSMIDIYIYQNPQALYFQYYTNQYFIFYESNESGNFEIYGVEFFADGSFGEPHQLTNTEEDEISFSIGTSVYDYSACWKSGNKVQFANIVITDDTLYFDGIVTIDTGDCFDPVCSEKMIFYQKMMSDSSHIYYSEFNSYTNLWSTPDTIYATGNNINLKMGSTTDWYYFEENICWENNGTILCWDQWSGEISTLYLQDPMDCYEPSFLTFDLYVDNFPYPSLITFTSEEEGLREVYAGSDFYFEMIGISDNLYNSKNPQVFYGQFYSYWFNAIDIWETEFESGNSLYMSQISISYGGEKENAEITSANQILKTAPNPFKENLNLEYFNEEHMQSTIAIYSITGKLIESVYLGTQAEGWNSQTWNPGKSIENNLPEGIYFIVLSQGEKTTVQKVIYSK